MGSGWGTHVNTWLIHVNVWQKSLQYCKVISLQLIKKKEEEEKKNAQVSGLIVFFVIFSHHISLEHTLCRVTHRVTMNVTCCGW